MPLLEERYKRLEPISEEPRKCRTITFKVSSIKEIGTEINIAKNKQLRKKVIKLKAFL